jgi:hypothetical protein
MSNAPGLPNVRGRRSAPSGTRARPPGAPRSPIARRRGPVSAGTARVEGRARRRGPRGAPRRTSPAARLVDGLGIAFEPPASRTCRPSGRRARATGAGAAAAPGGEVLELRETAAARTSAVAQQAGRERAARDGSASCPRALRDRRAESASSARSRTAARRPSAIPRPRKSDREEAADLAQRDPTGGGASYPDHAPRRLYSRSGRESAEHLGCVDAHLRARTRCALDLGGAGLGSG